MFVRTWRFITLMFVSLSMAMAFCHLLQLPPRMSYDAWLWRSTQSMYQHFGPPIGVIIESGAWILAAALAFIVRHCPRALWWTLLGAACMVLAHVAWWSFVFPVNNEMVKWTIDTIPADWMRYRNQWEYTHAVRAVLQIVGLGALLISVLAETPMSPTAGGRERTN